MDILGFSVTYVAIGFVINYVFSCFTSYKWYSATTMYVAITGYT